MNLPSLPHLLTHMEWADALVWRAALQVEAAATDDYVLDSLVHLHMVQRAYLQVWRGEAVEAVTREDFAGPDEVRSWARTYYSEVGAFLDPLADEDLAQILTIPWTRMVEEKMGRPVTPATLGEMVHQVVAHSVHHRAQINRRIREVGGDPPMVDFIGWVWRGRPEPEWPE